MIDQYGFPDIQEPSLDKAKRNTKQRINVAPKRKFVGSKKYWENRYEVGGNSGSGSYGQLAEFKAEIINQFVKEKEISSVIEFGSGDGNQLRYLDFENYLGFDVSDKALMLCREKFKNDPAKRFKNVTEFTDDVAECVLSLDVIFHLTEDGVFETYMNRLFEAAQKYVVIYSSNKEALNPSPHVRHRIFTLWIEANAPGWDLQKHIPNRYPYNGNNEEGSFCDFYIYKKMENN
jgi:hypothetical protein